MFPSSPLRVLTACVLLSAATLHAQSYQTSFTEVKFDRAKSPLLFHKAVQVDPATGAASVDFPIGPGIGARGATYQPRLSGRWAPQIQGQTWTYSGTSNQYSNITLLTSTGGFSFTPGQLDLVLSDLPPTPQSGPSFIPSVPAVSTAILPDGRTVTIRNSMDEAPVATGTAFIPGSVNPVALLASFGITDYTVADVPWMGVDQSPTPAMMCPGTQDELVIGLVGSSAPTRVVPSSVSIPMAYGSYWRVPDRILLVKNDIAYEFTYAVPVYWPGVSLSHITGGIAQDKAGGEASTFEAPIIQYSVLHLIKSVRYRLERVSNRFGDEVLFSYTDLGVNEPTTNNRLCSFTATWRHNGQAMGATITVHPWPLSITYTGGPSPVTLTTTGMQAVVPGAYAEEKPYLLFGKDNYPTRYFYANYDFRIDTFTLVEDAYTVGFGFAPTTLQGPGAGGGWLRSVTVPGSITTLAWSTYEFRRNLGGPGYHQVHYPEAGPNYALDGRWLPMYFQGVTQVDEQDTSPANAGTRTTLYQRAVPRPDLGTLKHWLTLDHWARVTHPDLSSTLFTYFSPLQDATGDPADGATPDEQLQVLAHLKHLPRLEQHYGPNGGLVKTINYLPSGSAATDLSLRALNNPAGNFTESAVPYSTGKTIVYNLTGLTGSAGLSTWSGLSWTFKRELEGGIDHSVTTQWEFDAARWEGPRPTFEQRVGMPACQTTYDTLNRPVLKVFNQGVPSLSLALTYTSGLSSPDLVTLTGTGATGTASASYGFDAFGLVSGIALAGLQGTATEVHDGFLRPTSQTDLNGLAKTIAWDPSGRLASMAPPFPEWSTAVTYDADHLGARVQQGPSNITAYRYNGLGELISIQKPTGEIKTFRYDAGGRKTYESLWGGTTGTTTAYEDEGFRPTRTTDPNGLVTLTTYAGLDRTVTLGAASTRFTQGGFGRLVSVVDALNQTTHYNYDLGDRVTTVTQQGTGGTQQVRSWTYNSLGWLMALTQPESGTTAYSDFTVLGKPRTTTYANGATVTTTYDPSGRVTAVQSSGTLQVAGVIQSFTYDGGPPFNGKLRQSTDGGIGLTYTYAGLNGRLDSLTLTQPAVMGTPLPTFTQSFSYDPSGLRTSATLPGGRSLSLGLDLQRGLQTYVSGAPGLPGTTGAPIAFGTLLNFNPEDSPQTLLLSNNAATTFTYGADLVRLDAMTHAVTGSSPLSKSWTYTYDSQGQMTNDGDAYPSIPVDQPYKYDLLNRLVSAKFRTLTSEDITQSFTYDAFGNRLSSYVNLSAIRAGVRSNFTNVTFAAADLATTNRIPAFTATGSATGASYDGAGNLLQLFKEVAAPNRAVTLTYDALGRVVGMADQERAVTETYSYTAEGLRTRIEASQGLPPGPRTLTKVEVRVYNDQRQLTSQYECVQE